MKILIKQRGSAETLIKQGGPKKSVEYLALAQEALIINPLD